MIPHVRNESRSCLGVGGGVSGPSISCANGIGNGMTFTEMSATFEFEDDPNFLTSDNDVEEEETVQRDDILMVDFHNLSNH